MRPSIAESFLIAGVIWTASVVVSAETSTKSVSAEKAERAGETDKTEIPSINKRINKRWRFLMPTMIETGAGYLSGDGVHTDAGPVIVVNLGVDPHFAFRKRKLKVGVTADYQSRESLGFSLAERHLYGGPFIDIRFKKKYTLSLFGEAGQMFRPGYPDPYQPKLDANGDRTGALLPTSRFSYFHAAGGADFSVKFQKRLSGKVYSEYAYRNNAADPSYDAVDNPTHLVPGDRHRARAGLGLSGYVGERIWRYMLDVRLDWTRYLDTVARDAKTGLTHAAPGGEPSNPMQRFLRIRIRERNSFRLYKQVLKGVLAADYTRNIDTFEGYYTWNQLGADVGVSLDPIHVLHLAAAYAFEYRRYTENGYQESSNHPPLDNGDSIRISLSHGVKGGIDVALKPDGLRLFVEGSWRKVNTNFPDYEPGVFPSSAQYRIDWDTLSYFIIGGVRLTI